MLDENRQIASLMTKLEQLGTLSVDELNASKAPTASRRHGISRQYAAARQDRLTADWVPSTSSGDAELAQGLTTIRARSRSLTRDSSYAKRARNIVVTNVIGPGMGMQAQVRSSRGGLNKAVNEDIEGRWKRWTRADSCHTGGRLSFAAFERAVMAQIFEAGEVFIRKHFSRFGSSDVPYALELIEAERVPIGLQYPAMGTRTRMGIELDRFQRPMAYWILENHPGDFRYGGDVPERIERVPASQIIHLALINRWPQTRGEPWLHTAIRRLHDMDSYSESEIVRARAQAVRMGIIETPEAPPAIADEVDANTGEALVDLEPGIIERLNPGEVWKDSSPTAPNPNLDPFMKYMIKEVCAGIGVSYASLSCDFSDSNYSSSRLSLLEDRDNWRTAQSWLIEDFRAIVHRDWIQQAVFARDIRSISVDEYMGNVEKFEAVRFRPRGWGWVDPTKEVQAFKDALRCGFTTLEKVLATSGDDIEEVIEQLKHEREMIAAAGIVLDIDPAQVNGSGATQSAATDKPDAGTTGDTPEDESTDGTEGPRMRALSHLRQVK